MTEVIPNVSRSRSSNAGTAVSPRSTLPASTDRVCASAAARDASAVSRAATSTTELTSNATSTKTAIATTSSVRNTVKLYSGGVK